MPHVGSIAVPALAAKPIIDVLVTVTEIDDETCYLPALLAAGYQLRVREPQHRMVRTPERDVHVHIGPHGHPAGQAHLAFRDRLRTSPADRELYAETKRRLAQQDWPAMNHYADAKSEVIRDPEPLDTLSALWRPGESPGALAQPHRSRCLSV